MKKTYPCIITENSVVVVKGGKRLVAFKNHPQYAQIIEKLRNRQFTNIERLFNVKDRIEKYFKISLKNGSQIFYDNMPIHGVVAGKILTFMREGLPYKPLVNFLNKIKQNPDKIGQDSLYDYLTQQMLPICDDGDFLGVKAVKNDFYDIHSGTILNRVGTIISMSRDKVNINKQECAGEGLHIGSASYVRDYGQSDSKFLLVKINPKDVCVVPTEGTYQKIRVCKYKVVSVINRDSLDFNSDYAPKNKQFKTIAKTNTRENYLAQKRNKSGRFVKS